MLEWHNLFLNSLRGPEVKPGVSGVYFFTLPIWAAKYLMCYSPGFKLTVLRSYFQLVLWLRADWKSWLGCIFVFSMKVWHFRICKEQCDSNETHFWWSWCKICTFILRGSLNRVSISQTLNRTSKRVQSQYLCRKVHPQFKCSVKTRREPWDLHGSRCILCWTLALKGTQLKWERSDLQHFQHTCQSRSQITWDSNTCKCF